jgi:hypothetical protein
MDTMDKFDKFWEANIKANSLRLLIHDKFGKYGSWEVDNADTILVVSKLEHISPELLAVTWLNESTFRFYSEPNTNGFINDFSKHDVGPLQLNVYWTLANIQVKYLNPVGLDVDKALGTISKIFNGDPMQNLRLGARRLLRGGKTDTERVVNFPGPKSRNARLKSWQEFGPLFSKFFEVYGSSAEQVAKTLADEFRKRRNYGL